MQSAANNNVGGHYTIPEYRRELDWRGEKGARFALALLMLNSHRQTLGGKEFHPGRHVE